MACREPIPASFTTAQQAMNILNTPCPNAWRAACAIARAAGQPQPSWDSWITASQAPQTATAIADDLASQASGDGSLWQL